MKPHLSLLNSTGTQLLSDYDSGGYAGPGEGYSSLLTYTATATGTFYLASNALGNGTGAYKLSATSVGAITDDYAASTSTTGVVAIGGSTTGNIETTGDADWFAVTLTAGVTYQFDLQGSATGQGTLEYPLLKLLNSAGSQLLSDQASGGFGSGPGWTSKLLYTASVTGTFYLASDPLGNELGIYKISATQLSGPTAFADAVSVKEDAAPNPVVGNVLSNDQDANGDPLTVTNAGTYALAHGSLALNADGTFAYTLDNSKPAVNALNDGQTLAEAFTYQISDGHGGTSSATLTVTIKGTTNGNDGGTLAGTPGNDLIDAQGGNDRINAGAGNDKIIRYVGHHRPCDRQLGLLLRFEQSNGVGRSNIY